MPSLQDRLCSAAHEDDERPAMRLRGVAWALAFALFFWGGVLLLLAPAWLDRFIRWMVQ